MPTRNTAKTLRHYKVVLGSGNSVPLLIFHRGCENFAEDVTNSVWGNVMF